MTTDPRTTDAKTAEIDPVAAALPAYEIGGQLGKGGGGVVLAGRHRRLDRAVAIKQLPPAFATDPIVRRRFVSEGRLLASLDHPHVVPVYDYVETEQMCLLVMELLPGGTVWSRFTGDGFDAPSAVAVALSCAAGLEAAHCHGILHRDIKPENLMFAASGALKVTDFGIAKVVGGDETMATKTGEVIGTPSYIAPEQARGGELTPATDVYALATMLYELLSGCLPFPAGQDALATLFMHAFDDPTPLSEAAPNTPEHLAEVIMRGLATDPAQRYPTAEAFGVALAEASTEPWGPGWLSAQGIPVMGADTIAAAARTTGPISPTVIDGAAARGLPTARAVRPVPGQRAQGVRLDEVVEADLVPVKEVIKLPSPRIPLLIAAGLALIALAVSLIGVGSPSTGGTLPPGAATVGGVDPAAGEQIPIDLNQPVVVTAVGPSSAATAELRLKVLGATVAEQSAPLVPEPGRSVATLPALGGQHLVAGEVTGELVVTEPGVPPSTSSFPVNTAQPALPTAAAVGVGALILFALAYLESFLRSLRHRRRRVSGGVGVPVSAGVLAVGMVGAAWILFGSAPTIATVVTAAVFGMLAGVAAAIGAWRIGQRRRYRRKEQIKEQARIRSRAR
ncbi:protein kinase domain-containing protein [Nocardia sp. IBHARD005]|uniref:protein kinase domain-containing protein n=1 Tax=Nocardia sp. IBHARD005 TaxID=3457765 RepID=UPI004058F373